MKGPEDTDLDRVHALMMAALDDECSEAERRELEGLIAGRPDLAVEWQRLRRLKEVTMTIDVRTPPEEVWDRYRITVLHRAERSVAWILIVTGGAVLGGWAFWHWLAAWLAADIPLLIRIASAALGVGLVLLLASIMRERWVLHRRDPYSKEVTR